MKTKRKNIFKSLLALTLALIMVLGVAPISELAGVDWASLFAPKAEAEGSEILNYDLMEAEYITGKRSYPSSAHFSGNTANDVYRQYAKDDLYSPTVSMLDSIESDKTLSALLTTWKAYSLGGSPSSATGLIMDGVDYCETLLAMALKKTLSETAVTTVLKSEVLGDSKDLKELFDSFCDTSESLDLSKDSGKIQSSLKKAVKDLYKDTPSKASKVEGAIGDFIKYSKNIVELCQKVATYSKMLDLDDFTKEWLNRMYEANEINGNDPDMRIALNNLIVASSGDSGFSDLSWARAGFTGVEWIVQKGIDEGIKILCRSNPVVAAIFAGLSIGSTICNLFFATDDICEQLYVMQKFEILQNIARSAMMKCQSGFELVRDIKSAQIFNKAVEMYFHIITDVDCDCMSEFLTKLYTGGYLKDITVKIKGASGDYESCTNAVEDLRNVRRNNYNYIITYCKGGFKLESEESYSYYFGEKSTEIPVESISLRQNNIEINMDGFLNLFPQYTPSDTTQKGVIYTSSDESIIPSGNTGILFPKKAGTVTITLTSIYNSSIKTSVTVTVTDSESGGGSGGSSGGSNIGIIDSGTCGENLTWKLTEAGTLIISGTGAMTNYETSSWVGAPWRNYRDNITKVVINNGVTSIGDSAFYNYGALENIIFGNNVVSIGKDAFRKCKSLTRLVFPQSLKSIGENAFVDCTGLISITLNNMEDINEIRAFYNCEKLANLIIGRKVNVINNFIATDYLSNITVETGNEFFSSKDGVLFDKQQKELIYYPKKKVDSTYVIPNTVTRIGKGSFPDCSNLISLTIPDSVTNIDCTLDGEKLTEVSLPCGVVRSKDSSWFFNKSDNLERITITSGKNGVIGARMDTFIGKAKQLVISEGVTKICRHAFFSSDYLESVIFPLSMKEIEPDAFRYCKKLKDIVIPGDIAEIYEPFTAFETEIENITISDGCNMIKDNFLGCLTNSYYGIKKITISSSVDEINEKFDWKNLERIEVDSDNKYFSSDENGVLYNKDKTKLIRFPSGSLKSEYTIPDSVVSICDYAFYDFDNNCEKLTRVTIPDSVISIGNEAFYDRTSLTSVTLGNGVTSIGDWAFHGCTGLTGITIPDSVTSIGQRAFQDCTGLTSVTIGKGVKCIERFTFSNCSNLMSVTIPNSVTSIRENAFEDCTGLTSVTLGNSVTSIGYGAFRDCTGLTSVTLGNSVTSIYEDAFEACQSLKDVYYLGTEAQWENITIGSNNDYLTNATIHFNWKPCTHKWSTWKTVTKPTLDSEGLEKRVCSKCGAEETRAISKLEPVAVTSVKLSKSKKSLNIGDTFTLTATVKPNDATDKSVTWSSSDTSVATVDENGVVTAVTEGTATITATASNGVKADCTVTVKQKGDSIFKKIFNVILAPFRAIINLFKKLFGK